VTIHLERSALVICLTRLDGKELVVNVDHVLTVEATPDTMLVLTTGLHLMVKERVEDVVDRAASWKRRVVHGPWRGPEREGRLVPLPSRTED
jgi:flagellar protein FlbD